MLINLYNYNSESIRVNKTPYLNILYSLEGTLRSNTSIIDPTFEIETENFPECNYVYIPDFKRYYFVKNISCNEMGLWTLSCHVDVLMSFKDQFLSLKGFVERYNIPYTESKNFVDEMYPAKSVPDFTVLSRVNVMGDSDWVKPWLIIVLDGNGPITKGVSNPSIYLRSENKQWKIAKYPNAITSITMTCKIIAIPFGTAGYSYEIQRLMSEFINDSNIVSHMLGVYIYTGYDIISDSFTQKTTGSISIGNKSIQCDDGTLQFNGITYNLTLYEAESNSNYKSGRQYLISNVEQESFLQLPPYTNYSLYIPCVGWIDLDSKYVLNRYIFAYYFIDFTIGYYNLCLYSCKDGDPNAVLIQRIDIPFSANIPMNTTGFAEQSRQRSYNEMTKQMADAKLLPKGLYVAANAADRVGDVLSKALSLDFGGAVGSAVGGALRIAGDIADLAIEKENNETAFKQSEIMNLAVGNPSSAKSIETLFASANLDIILMSTTAVNPDVDMTLYSSLVGVPYKKFVQLSELQGLATITAIHIEGINNILENEKQALTTFLANGVIF